MAWTLQLERFGFRRMLQGDEEMMQRALERNPGDLVGLRVRLLSGRCCHDAFHHEASREDVLRILCPIYARAFRTGSAQTGSE